MLIKAIHLYEVYSKDGEDTEFTTCFIDTDSITSYEINKEYGLVVDTTDSKYIISNKRDIELHYREMQYIQNWSHNKAQIIDLLGTSDELLMSCAVKTLGKYANILALSKGDFECRIRE